MSDSVTVRIEDGIATVEMNEPNRLNAFSPSIIAGLREAFSDLESSDARCVVMTGAGRAFSAGGDIDEQLELIESDRSLDDRMRSTLERRGNRLIETVVDFPLPTVAKINGPAVGGGANLAIACDIQLASSAASIGFVFRQVGLSVDMGSSALLPDLVGRNVAKELVFRGTILSADEALELGLVNHVYDEAEFDDRVATVVDEISSGPTIALTHAKQALNRGANTTVQEALRTEALSQGIVFETDDHEEGVRAFLADRNPEFRGE